MRCIVMALLCLGMAPFLTGCGGGGCTEASTELHCADETDTTPPDVAPPPGRGWCTNNPACT
jgi:hypothetical protein